MILLVHGGIGYMVVLDISAWWYWLLLVHGGIGYH